MTSGASSRPGRADADPSGRAEPITLTDPDGAVTRVAPWSTWTREQVRAPGGEPSLVTRLTDGQLWYASGRRRSPWRHEVQVGPAVVSTPRGRFQATAEPDGGATVACLAGRTRVVAGQREPVVLGPDQTAAVSSDGATLVVMDRPSATEADDDGPEGPTRGGRAAATASAGAAPEGDGPMDDHDVPPDGPEPVPVPVPGSRRRRVAEVVAVASLLTALVAAVVVFGREAERDDVVAGPGPTAAPSTTTEAPPTTTEPPPTTTEPPVTTTEPPPPTTPPTALAPATAAGDLASCRRADGGVVATISVTHRSGGPGRFTVGVGLVDAGGQVFAEGQGQSEVLDPGATVPVDVLVPVDGPVQGACELLGVTPA